MRTALRTSRFLVLLTALVTTIALVMPLGQTARAADIGEEVPTANGWIKISSISPAKDVYNVGDVVTVVFRLESNADAPKRDIVATSTTLENVSSCDWEGFPAALQGMYNCARTGMPAVTYTVTEADAAEGEANFSLTFTETAVGADGEPDGTDPVVTTIDGTLAVADEPAGPRPEGEYVALASAGDFGFTCHRIPALTTAPNGDVLASWDGRPGGCADAPQANSIIQRRSTDGGQTWGDITTIAAGQPTPAVEKFGYSDPSYVTDRVANKVFAFFLKSYDRGWGNSEVGTDPDARNVLHAAVSESSDNGLTWSEPTVITTDITGDPATWSSRFAASGEGIQLQYAPYEGRLVQQYTVNVGGVYQAVSVFSDDNGATWEAGTPVGVRMDENKVVELSDGRLMINSRDNAGSGYRKVTYSSDGGETYGEVTLDRTLIDPRNNASIIRAYPDAPKDSAKAKILLFSNAASQSSRSNGIVRVSFDDGQTWSGSRIFEPGSMSYSTLTALTEEGTYGLFFEGAGNQMRYMTISMDWLGVLPLSITAEEQTLNRGANTVTFSVTNVGAEAVTFTPSIAGPTGWTLGAVDEITLPAGESAMFTVEVTVPDTVDPANYTLTASVEDGDQAAKGTASVPVELQPGQNPSTPLAGIAPVNTPPAQPGQGIDKAFDGDVATLWHTPWGAVTELPVEVDIKLGEAPVQIANLEYVPRQSGNNGRIDGYEIWAGNTLDESDLTKIASGNFVDSAAAKKVLLDGEYQYLRLRTVSSYGSEADAQYVSAAEFRVNQAVADTEVLPLEVTLANSLEAQNGFGSEKMFDNDTGTWFHTPYAATQTFPYNIDLALGDEPVNVTSFVMTPRLSDVAGDNNGRPGQYTILVGDSLDDMTIVDSGTWEDTGVAKTVELDATGKFVRLAVDSTYGDGAGNVNKYVAIAELDVFGTVVPPAPKLLEVSLARTDEVGAPVEVGDELTFTISYANISDRTITAYPRESNLTDVLVDDAKNCRWAGLEAGTTKECGFARYTVTAEDLTAGSFTPSVTFDATADRDGTEILQEGVVATLPAIEVGEVDVTPTATPTVTVTAPEVTATSTNTVTATSTATATATSSATVTATSTATATATSSATATSTNTVTATSTATVTATATAPPVTVTPTTGTPTVKPTQRPVNVYTDPGYHEVNGRQWFTKCEPYSATERCFTSIWASQVKTVNGKQQWVTGWVFNNLTYLPMEKETWKGNKLAYTNEWNSAEGRKWKTECGTPATGRDGCRSYILTTVWVASTTGSISFVQDNRWVLNNMLSFS